MQQNRRAHLRVDVESEVWLGMDGVFTRGTERLTNLSVGGAFIEIRGGYALRSILSLRFSLGPQFITSTVIVRNIVPGGGIGVEFIDISDENKDRIMTFITRQTANR